MRIAMLALCAIVLGLVLGKTTQGPAFTPSTFAHKYYFYGYPVNELQALVDSLPNQREMIEKAVFYYEKQDFDQLLPLLQKLEVSEPRIACVRFYIGLCYHYTKQKQQAIQAFSQIEAEVPFFPAAQWYKALTYVLFNDVPHALEGLNAIQTGPYVEKVRALEADLN